MRTADTHEEDYNTGAIASQRCRVEEGRSGGVMVTGLVGEDVAVLSKDAVKHVMRWRTS